MRKFLLASCFGATALFGAGYAFAERRTGETVKTTRSNG